MPDFAPVNRLSPRMRELERRLDLIREKGAPFLVENYGSVRHAGRDFALHRVLVGSLEKPRVAILAGFHRHEPAGVNGVLDLLEHDASTFIKHLTLEVYPCVNPSGYEGGTRMTMAGVDLNRQFGPRSDVPEVVALLRSLASYPKRYLAVLDNHQDVEEADWKYPGPTPDCFYLYASAPPGDHFAADIVASLPAESVFRGDNVYGDRCINGVIDSTANLASSPYAQSCDLEQHMFREDRAIRCLAFETPGSWPLDKAASLHRTAITSALRLLVTTKI